MAGVVAGGGGRPLPPATRTLFEEGFASVLGSSSISSAPAVTSRAMTVSRPGDPLEGQADSVAAQVLRAPRAPHPEMVRPDFSQVRIHTDGPAARSAAALNATAYTVRDHIVFGAGRFDPGSADGRRLLAHELTHVLQQRASGDTGTIHRQACAHDGRQPECGGYRWRLINIVTDEVINEDLDHRIVESGLVPNFGGRWVTQVQTPPNMVKGGKNRGRVDGLRVRAAAALRVEVVEVKSRATGHNGGCGLASREAAEYVRQLNLLGPHVVTISRVLSANPLLRPAGGRVGQGQRRMLAALGVDLSQQRVGEAWRFLFSLEERLGTRFSTPFSTFTAAVNTDGVPGTDYMVGPPVLVDCRKRGKAGVKIRRLLFQVNGAGGVSYGCDNTDCQVAEEDEREERVRATRRQSRSRSRRQTVDASQTPGEAPEPSRIPLVAIGAGAVATAAGLAAARRQAARAAARRAAIELARREAARRAALAAARRTAEEAVKRRAARAAAAGAGRRVVGGAAGRAVVIAEAAAFVLVLATGEAKAELGPGKSSLEALYEVMTRNGTPPSAEMRQLIENDPVLRQLAERAAETGDAAGLQQELDRRSLEFLRDHAHELTEEELDLLLAPGAARGAGGPLPQDVEQLRAAIAAERERRGTAAVSPGTRPGAGATPGGGPGGGAGREGAGREGAGGERAGRAAGSGGAAGEEGDARARRARLSPEMQRQLAAASAPRRALAEAIISGGGQGPAVDAEAVRRILAAIPADLTDAESGQLAERVGPAAGRSVEEVVASIGRGVSEVRAGARAERGAQGADAVGPAQAPTPQEAAAARAEYVNAIIENIRDYPFWNEIPVNGYRFVTTGATNFRNAEPGRSVEVILLVRQQVGGTVIRAAGTGRAAVIDRRETTLTIESRSSILLVTEARETVTNPAGRRFTGRLVGAGR
ncbi:eCIS core domain-containing protein [Streptosporangium soli]|nr:DUF4157 domain-containing protein [Streptosporangium sp. KLBMP 9127]